MELTSESFLDLMKNQFEIESDKVGFDVAFRNLNDWSSLQALIVITVIDDEFGVTIEESELRNAITFGDLFHLVRTKK